MGGERDGTNQILTHDLFTGISNAHGCSTGVVSLSWAVQRGITVIPKSSSKPRIADNIKLVDLTDDEMDKINNAHQTIQRYRISDHISSLWSEMDGKPVLQGWTNEDFGWEDKDGNWLV